MTQKNSNLDGLSGRRVHGSENTFMTVDELAELTRIGRDTIYREIKADKIPGARRIGRTIRIDRDTVLAWLAGKDHVPRSRSK